VETAAAARGAAGGGSLQVELSPGQLEAFHAAAEKSGQRIEVWAVLALQQAAHKELRR
jgi:hypothetical protein